MANRTFSRVQALNHGVKVISGRIGLPLLNDDPNDSDNNADGDDQLVRNATPIAGLGFCATSVGGAGAVPEDAGNCKIYLGIKELASDPATENVTLDKIESDKYVDLISSSGSVLLNDGRSGVVSFISEDTAGVGTVNIRVSQASDGAAVALQGEASGEIQFTLVLRNSSADSR